MFQVNNKDTRTTPMTSFWCLYCKLETYFTPCPSVSIVNLEHVIAGWVYELFSETLLTNFKYLERIMIIIIVFFTKW